jgi:hypothetical protein
VQQSMQLLGTIKGRIEPAQQGTRWDWWVCDRLLSWCLLCSLGSVC